MVKRPFTQEEFTHITDLFHISIDRNAYSISMELEAFEANLYLKDKHQGNKTIAWLVINTDMSVDTFNDQIGRFELALARTNHNHGVIGHG